MIVKSTFNYGMVFALMAIILYGYAAFTGLILSSEIDATIAIAIAASWLVLACVALYTMCDMAAKHSTNSRRRLLAIAWFIFILLFVVAFWPFAKFVEAYTHRENLSQYATMITKYVTDMDSLYDDYVERRVSNYEKQLRAEAAAHTSKYPSVLGGAYGTNDKQKINNLVSSLKRRLEPTDKVQNRALRQEWVKTLDGLSLSNVRLPMMLKEIDVITTGWYNEYVTFSKTPQSNVPFSPYPDQQIPAKPMLSNLKLASAIAEVSSADMLIKAGGVAFVFLLVMLFPYILIPKNR